jgi:hypothetical protein
MCKESEQETRWKKILPDDGEGYHSSPSSSSIQSPTLQQTFLRGDLAVDVKSLGIKVCTGMQVKVLTKANETVVFENGSESELKFHSMPDGAAIIELDDDGYVYVSNAEMSSGRGGVYGLYFNNNGDMIDYKQLLNGTTRNCGGGATPWKTWISCEEYGNGQCHQIDPHPNSTHHHTPAVTKLGGLGLGGNYESVAVDKRNAIKPVFYLTEDSRFGVLRKYTPPPSVPFGWESLQAENGT